MTPSSFFAEAAPWARTAHVGTGVLVSVILAQWADETGFGGPDWYPNNNPGNVGSYDGKPVATFPTLSMGVAAYIQTMNLPYYVGVRAAVGADAQARALGESPWASGHYGNPPGSDLIAIINSYGLTAYDWAQPVPPLPGGQEELDFMALVVLADGTVVSQWVGRDGTGSAGHAFLMTSKAGTVGQQPAGGPNGNTSIIDYTAVWPFFTVQSGG